mgnify:CR=1 FL=1
MAGQRYSGKHSPRGRQTGTTVSGTATPPQLPPFRNRRARRISVRARFLYLLPLPLLFAGLGAITRGSPREMLAELG